MTERNLAIYTIPNNMTGRKPRKPLVQLLGSTGYGDVASFVFHPRHAEKIARAILNAGKSAAAGRRRLAVNFVFPDDED